MKDELRNCIVLMPFGISTRDQLYSHLLYKHRIMPAVKKAGLKPVRVDIDPRSSEPIRDTLQTHLKTAPMAVADLTANNPNVFFELGYRVARGLPFVCIADAPSTIAFWGQTWHVLDYVSKDAVGKIARAIREELPFNSVAKIQSSEISDTIGNLVKLPSDYFIDWLIAMRLRTVQKQIATIKEGRWVVHAWRPIEYIARVITEVMNELKPGDEYDTVTNAGFWSDNVMGTSAFLKANITAAERGVKIRRLFLVDCKSFAEPNKFKQIVTLLEQHGDAASKHSNLKVAVLLCDNYRDEFTMYGHCAVLRIGNSGIKSKQPVLIIPYHEGEDAGGDITRLEISFDINAMSSDTTYIRGFEAKFEAAWARGKPVSNVRDVHELLRLGADTASLLEVKKTEPASNPLST